MTNRVTPIPSNLSITATHAAINKAVIANINNDDADDDNNDAAASDAGEYNYFGDMPNPDPKDISLCDLCGDFILLFAKLKKIAKDYSKDRKVCQSLPLIIPSP